MLLFPLAASGVVRNREAVHVVVVVVVVVLFLVCSNENLKIGFIRIIANIRTNVRTEICTYIKSVVRDSFFVLARTEVREKFLRARD